MHKTHTIMLHLFVCLFVFCGVIIIFLLPYVYYVRMIKALSLLAASVVVVAAAAVVLCSVAFGCMNCGFCEMYTIFQLLNMYH
jgi:hypothetical protein